MTKGHMVFASGKWKCAGETLFGKYVFREETHSKGDQARLRKEGLRGKQSTRVKRR